MDLNTLNETRRRTERYWYQDGIWEIGFGLVNLLLGGFFMATRQMEARGLPSLLLALAQLLVIVAVFWLMGRLVRFLKERITYPRTGYVAYRRTPAYIRARRGLLTGLLAGGLAAFLAILSATQHTTDLSPLASGVVFAAAMLYLGQRFALLRLSLLAAPTLLLAAGATFLPGWQDQPTAIFFGGLGILFLLSGGITLLLYLRSTRPAGPDLDYEAPDESHAP